MVRIAPVNLPYNPKMLWFDAGELELHAGCDVVVQTARGTEFGHMPEPAFEATSDQVKKLKPPLKPVLRVADDEDRAKQAELEARAAEALPVFKELAAKASEEMRPVSVEYLFDGDKAVFYFESENRVDFRELVKDLASVFHTRIELRQIGVRDEAKMLGGLGPCGRPICCGSFLGDFQPVSIKMAKEQNLSLNPTKISGVCGRLMCCLKFEQGHYESTRKRMPKVGKEVETPEGVGVVVDINVLKETLTVRIHKGDTSEFKVFPLEEVKWARPASQPCEGRNPEGKQPEQRGARAQARRTRQNRPLISSDDETPAPTDEELPLETEEEMQPVDQSNDWLKAVEEALNAAKDKE